MKEPQIVTPITNMTFEVYTCAFRATRLRNMVYNIVNTVKQRSENREIDFVPSSYKVSRREMEKIRELLRFLDDEIQRLAICGVALDRYVGLLNPDGLPEEQDKSSDLFREVQLDTVFPYSTPPALAEFIRHWRLGGFKAPKSAASLSVLDDLKQ